MCYFPFGADIFLVLLALKAKLQVLAAASLGEYREEGKEYYISRQRNFTVTTLPLPWHWCSLRLSSPSVENAWLLGTEVWEEEDFSWPAYVVSCFHFSWPICQPDVTLLPLLCSGLPWTSSPPGCCLSYTLHHHPPKGSNHLLLDSHSSYASLIDLSTSLSLFWEFPVLDYVKGASNFCYFSILPRYKNHDLPSSFIKEKMEAHRGRGADAYCIPVACEV